ncbi:MAG: hypothetical protein ACOH2F_00265 [Cellulomonas sp.]
MFTYRVGLLGVAILTLDACSSGGSNQPASTATGSETVSTPSADASDAATGTGSELRIARTALGEVLVDAAGMTLYMYDPDTTGPSTCYDQCATAWPPLVVDGTPAVGPGADDSKVGTSPRTGGSVQVTYGGWPVYYFAKDANPGDTTGQGVGGVWWVLDADGTPIRAQ